MVIIISLDHSCTSTNTTQTHPHQRKSKCGDESCLAGLHLSHTTKPKSKAASLCSLAVAAGAVRNTCLGATHGVRMSMLASYGRIASRIDDVLDDSTDASSTTIEKVKANSKCLLAGGGVFLILTLLLNVSGPQQSVHTQDGSSGAGAASLAAPRTFSPRRAVRCASTGENELDVAAVFLGAASGRTASMSKNTCWTAVRMAAHAKASGMCYFVAKEAPTTNGCYESMHFCLKPLHLSSAAGYTVFSACPDEDPMTAIVDMPSKPRAEPHHHQVAIPPSASNTVQPQVRTMPTQTAPPPPPRKKLPAASAPPPPPPAQRASHVTASPKPHKAATLSGPGQFVQVAQMGRSFQRNGRAYRFVGTTMWYGAHLASRGSGGDRERLARELDRLKGLGVTHVRVLASGEGESCMIPAITTKPGVYSASLLEGLDYFLAELAKRDMVATLILNNGLPWSGGMSAYVEWVTQSRSPFAETHSWDSATHYEHATRFFKLDAAMKLFEDYIRMLVSRVNTVTGSTYSKDPTIMAWEIANEPRIGGRNLDAAYEPWVRRVAELLKSLDPNHLVTLGSDGTGGGVPFNEEHNSGDIDFTTIHVWPEKFNWYRAEENTNASFSLANAIKRMEAFVSQHVTWSEALNKPLVVEAFGLSRDHGSLSAASPTTQRDSFYKAVFRQSHSFMTGGHALSGVSFWAWGGEARMGKDAALGWGEGDPYTGDAPSDPQGRYSIFDSDKSTCDLIKGFASYVNNARRL